MTQLTLDGREDNDPTPIARAAPFTRAQRTVIEQLRRHGAIRSIEAGQIVHAHRQPPCERCAAGVCPWASSDGSDALKRLLRRGIVAHKPGGGWQLA